MDKDILKLYLFIFFRYFGFMGGVFVIFLLNCGLNFFQISLINAILSISVTLFEIPTGLIADKYSRKWTIFTGEFGSVVLWISLIFIRNANWFLIWAFFSGLTYSLSSGSIVSMVYDNLKYKSKEENFKKIQANYKTISQISMFLGGVIGGFIASMSFSMAIYLSALSYSVSVFFLLLIKEFPYAHKKEKKAIFSNFRSAISFVKLQKDIKLLILMLVYFEVVIDTVLPYVQVYVYLIISSLPFVSIVVSVIDLSVVLGYRISNKLRGNKRFLLLTLWVMVIINIFIGFYHTFVSLFFIIIVEVISGVFIVIWHLEFQKRVLSDKRAVVTSLAYSAVTLSLTLFYPMYGYIIDLIGLYNAILYVSFFLAIFLFVFTIISYFINFFKKSNLLIKI